MHHNAVKPHLARPHTTGITIVEILVAVGVLSLILSLLMPALAGVKERAGDAKSASNLRQMGLGLTLYAASYNDLPPVFGGPAWPPKKPWAFDFGTLGSGNWFEHSFLYSLAVTALLDSTDVANAPGRPDGPRPVLSHQGQPVSLSDYLLTNTLYADPAFFNWNTQTGPTQFRPQRLASIAFPDAKALLFQTWIFHRKASLGVVPSCCVLEVPSPLFFADGSVSDHVLMRLPPGIVNLYGTAVYSPQTDPLATPGYPVLDTVDGILGRDKP